MKYIVEFNDKYIAPLGYPEPLTAHKLNARRFNTIEEAHDAVKANTRLKRSSGVKIELVKEYI